MGPPKRSGRYFINFSGSGVGWREAARMSANRILGTERMAIFEDREAQSLRPGSCGVEDLEGGSMLSVGLANDSAHYQLEYPHPR